MSVLCETTGTGMVLRGGRVERQAAGAWLVESEGRTAPARRALACLVEPEPGDRILLAEDGDGSRYILSVLERLGQDACLSVPGNLDIRSDDGAISLRARTDVDVRAGDSMRLGATCASVVAQRAELSATEAAARGERLTFHFGLLRTVAETVETTAGKLVQILRAYFRRVEEMEDVRAGTLLIRVKSMLALRSHFAQLIGKRNVKIEGDQIHMS